MQQCVWGGNSGKKMENIMDLLRTIFTMLNEKNSYQKRLENYLSKRYVMW